MPYLTLLTTAGETLNQWEFHNRVITVGRGATADFAVADKGMSREHFSIAPAESGYELKDSQSSNGTWVNSQRVKAPVPLKAGDQIRAGVSHFLFEDGLATCIRKIEKNLSADGPR